MQLTGPHHRPAIHRQPGHPRAFGLAYRADLSGDVADRDQVQDGL